MEKQDQGKKDSLNADKLLRTGLTEERAGKVTLRGQHDKFLSIILHWIHEPPFPQKVSAGNTNTMIQSTPSERAHMISVFSSFVLCMPSLSFIIWGNKAASSVECIEHIV